MVTGFRKVFPQSYLLVVASSPRGHDTAALVRALHRAGRSGKPAVWLDCSLLENRDVTSETCLLLQAYHDAFKKMGVQLILAHATHALQQCQQSGAEQAPPRLVGWLVESMDHS